MMRVRPRILLDIDGVFANFIAASLPMLRALTDRDLQHEDVKSYRMEEVFGLSADQVTWWHDQVKSPRFCTNIPPYDGARLAIAALQELGDVHPVTFPWPGSPYWIHEREEWLRDILGIDPGLAVYTSQKHLIAGDVLVEDTTKYLIKWREHHPDGVAIRVRRPYNANELFLQGVTVDNFVDLIGEVEAALSLRARKLKEAFDD